ncbi:hypothetical protein E6C50_05735 [Flavobacterium supellecticarium]|uniref:Uncharacterized protein n=1 Tax=Flavobacterium supellecticarium TaxID=2565924 RepID=A0A4S3ZZK1_9FLAO|nr:hypothetical protein [Flavobacterium supellecticarium]THF51272.1 hypothetical protein E6C50_05735 [Flavobacterium supellecticarium]
MKIYLGLFVLVLTCQACQNTEKTNSIERQKETRKVMSFDKEKWAVKSDAAYAYRAMMLQDLIDSKRLKQLKKAAILELLGTPDRTDSLYLFYTILQKRALFFPLQTKSMVIKLKENDSVEWVKIHE